jgi:YaiO family outer membrane protein
MPPDLRPTTVSPPHGGRRLARVCAGALACLCLAMPARPAAAQTRDRVEAGMDAQTLTGGYDGWRGLYLTGVRQVGAYEVWRVEAAFQQRFGDQGFLYKAVTTRGLSERWFGRAGIGLSSGGFFNPRLSLDLQAARRWLPDHRLVTLASLSLFDAKDVHRDYALTLEAQYYAAPSWVLQGSVRWNVSTPGSALAGYYFLALTHGYPERYYVAFRVGFGRESYVLVDPLTFFADYRSADLMLSWRRWTGKDWGFSAMLTGYANPFYRRAGVQVGFFKKL